MNAPDGSDAVKRSAPRRRVLAAITTVVGSLAGCTSSGPEAGASPSSPMPSERVDTMTEKSTTDASETSPTEPSSGERVTFESAGSGRVVGTLFGSGECGVVFAHGAVFDKESWYPQARAITAETGAITLPIDLTDTPAEDVLGAVRYVREEHNVKRVVLIGGSAGGRAILEANANADPGTIDGTLALAPAGGSTHVPNLQGRLLFVVSEGDGGADAVSTMHERAPQPKRLVTLPGNAHAQHIFDTDQGERLLSVMIEFVDEACG